MIHKAWPRERSLKVFDIFRSKLGGEQREVSRRRVGMDACNLQLAEGIAKLVELPLVGLGGGKVGVERLGPSLGFEAAKSAERVVLEDDLEKFVAALPWREGRDVVFGLAVFVALLGLLFHVPAEA